MWLRIFQSYLLNIFPFNLKWFFMWIESSIRAGRVCYLFTTWGLSAWKWTGGAQDCCSVTKLSLTLCDPMAAECQAPLSFSVSWSLLKLMSIESMMSSNHLILRHPLLILSSIFPSIGVSSSELALCTRWPKYWSLSFSNNPSNEYSGLISFRIDWFGLQSISPHSDTFFPYMRISRFTVFIGFLFGSMTNFLWS